MSESGNDNVVFEPTSDGATKKRSLGVADVVRWLLSGVVSRKSLVAFLASPLVVFVWYTVPFPWEPRFEDAAWLGPTCLTLAILLIAAVVLLALIAPRVVPEADDTEPMGFSLPKLPKRTKALVFTAAGLFLLLSFLLMYERFGHQSFLIKWPGHTATHNVLIGGTFKNVNFDKERLVFYVCTEVPDRARPSQPWIWRCWLDQHPPDVQLNDGLWQATCRFGNEEAEEMDRPNPTFEIVPVVARRGVERTALQNVVDSSASQLRAELLDNELVSCVGSVFTVKRTSVKYRLPNFTGIRDASEQHSFGPAPELRYTVCRNATITWGPAPGESAMPSYNVFFDGVIVAGGTGTSLAIEKLLDAKGGKPPVDDARWQRKERLELKISHDPVVQHYRNLYLYRKEDSDCAPPPVPVKAGQ